MRQLPQHLSFLASQRNPNWITDRRVAQQAMMAERDRQVRELYADPNMDSRTRANREAYITGDWGQRMATANQSQWWEGYSPGLADPNTVSNLYSSGWGSAGNGMALAAMNNRGADMPAAEPEPSMRIQRKPWGGSGSPFRNMPPDTQKSGTLLTGHRYTKPGTPFAGGGGRPNEGVTVIPPMQPYPKVMLPDSYDYPEPPGPDVRLDGSLPRVGGGFRPGRYSVAEPGGGMANYEFYQPGYVPMSGNLNNSRYMGWANQGEGPGAFGQFKNVLSRARGAFGGLVNGFQKAFYPQPK